MRKQFATAILATSALVLSVSPLADITPSGGDVGGAAPHAHASATTGKISMLRVQRPGIEYGPKEDRLDAEVLVQLDTRPKGVLGLRMHGDADQALGEIVALLKSAYASGQPVTIFHTDKPNAQNEEIIWVQLGEEVK
jgi:hypothetical protein